MSGSKRKLARSGCSVTLYGGAIVVLTALAGALLLFFTVGIKACRWITGEERRSRGDVEQIDRRDDPTQEVITPTESRGSWTEGLKTPEDTTETESETETETEAETEAETESGTESKISYSPGANLAQRASTRGSGVGRWGSVGRGTEAESGAEAETESE